MSSKNAARLAEILNLTMVAKEGPFGGPAAVGSLGGFPVAAAWTKVRRQPALAFLVRFKKGSLRQDSAALMARIAASPDLLAALGRKKLASAERKSLLLTADSLRFDVPWSLRAPSPETAASVLKALQAIIAASASPIGAACETCSASSADLYCVDGLPTSICAACREREGEEGRRRAEEYAAKPANPLMGTLAGAAACLLAAALWGGVAYALERIFLYGAILIGVAIAWSVNRGMGKVNAYGRVLAIGLTLSAVLLGDYIFILLTTSRQWGESISAEMARAVAGQFTGLEFSAGSTGWLSLLFGVIGAGYVLFVNRPPALRRRMVPVSSTLS